MRTEASSVTPVERRPGDAGRPRRTAPAARPEVDADEAGDEDALLMPRTGTRRPAGRAEHRDDEEDAAPPAADGRARRTLLPVAAAETGAREMAPAEPREEAARPVVQVTIGRIEVRAGHPPAAPQPARQAQWTPPVLSLDEYLKRGNGR